MRSKGQEFINLHLDRDIFIMANAWNAGSAILLEESGFEAIGTTSAGIAFSHGLPDSETAVSFEFALQETRKIVESVNVP